MAATELISSFEGLLKDTVHPFFKELGFKRKTKHWARQTNDIVQAFNVQRGLYSSYYNSLSFTLNIGFYNEQIFREVWNREDVPIFPKYYSCPLNFRLGIVSHQGDHWYELSSRVSMEELKNRLASDLDQFAYPLFNTCQSLASWLVLLSRYSINQICHSPIDQIAVLWNLGCKQETADRLRSSYKKARVAPINQIYVDSIKRLALLYNIGL
ncbi:DUF4304 domain-containing protein [Spirosoma validum]|uniref:DUF4304 domain-containing protein n=1 Tax=Spirosoma validum TaxID=2771355 RepID=A0A927B7H9_9BACT|nr:DUF4304 domain-containing protein [Spirosoma validum]MBD2756582.1 DUF4304 domain-containing protein [Spirosoma validum]